MGDGERTGRGLGCSRVGCMSRTCEDTTQQSTTPSASSLGMPLSAHASTQQHRCCCIVWSTKAPISPTGSSHSLAIVSVCLTRPLMNAVVSPRSDTRQRTETSLLHTRLSRQYPVGSTWTTRTAFHYQNAAEYKQSWDVARVDLFWKNKTKTTKNTIIRLCIRRIVQDFKNEAISKGYKQLISAVCRLHSVQIQMS